MKWDWSAPSYLVSSNSAIFHENQMASMEQFWAQKNGATKNF